MSTPTPADWKHVPLADLASGEPNAITDGPFGSKLKTEHYQATGPRVVRLQNIGDGEFTDERAHISPSHFASLHRHQVFAGDLVIAALGERLPRAALVPESLGPAIVKADCIRFKPDAKAVSAKYLLYALNSPQLRNQAQTIIHGVGRPRLNQGEIKALTVPVAPRPEQDRIVAEIEKQFTRLDAGVEALKRLQAHLRRYRAAVLKAAFRRFNGDEVLPLGWARAPLGEVVDILDRMRVPVNAEERATRPGLVPYYGSTGQVGWIDEALFDEELVLLGEDAAPFLDPYKPKAYLIRGKSWVNNHAHVLRGRGVSNAYLMHHLNALDYHGAVTGTTRLKLPQAPMKRLPLVVPPIDEQSRIVSRLDDQLSAGDALFDAVHRSLLRAARLRASVLRAAFNGLLSPSSGPVL